MSTNAVARSRFSLGLGQKQYSNFDVAVGIIAFLVQLLTMTAGALLIDTQIQLTKLDKEGGNKNLNYLIGSILIIIASLMVLYSIFKIVSTQKKV